MSPRDRPEPRTSWRLPKPFVGGVGSLFTKTVRAIVRPDAAGDVIRLPAGLLRPNETIVDGF
jgi:hypothetical protein